MKIRLASNLVSDSIVDGEGIRTVIWTQGCIHNCYGCHNQHTHSFTDGFLKEIEDVKKEIGNLRMQDGITFSGGDPMCQVDACLEISQYCKSIKMNVWCYTGYTYEELINLSITKPNIMEFLKSIDVLVDGKFILTEKSLNLKFKGSRNQRILDVKKSLKLNKPCEIKKYKENKSINKQERAYMFV